MSAVAKNIVPSLATAEPCHAHRVGSKSFYAGAALAAGDLVYINPADGLVYQSIGTTLNAAAAKVDGIVTINTDQGNTVTIYDMIDISYGLNTLTPGSRFYLSGTVPGGLDTAPSTGGTAPVAKVLYNNNNAATPHSVLRIFSSTY